MHISPFFHNLRSAYAAEIDDLSQDTDGTFVLQQRLAQRRSELDFLMHMLELSPEMVAVVLHKAFVFRVPQAIEQMLGCEPEDLPDWETLADTITIAPWADALVRTIRAQPAGDWFMTVAAGAEYMLGMASRSIAEPGAERDDAFDTEDADQTDEQLHLSADDAVGGDAQAREDAKADWMVEQGFDRKD